MKALKARITRSLPHYARVNVCDNSGARILKVISVMGHKTVKGRKQSAGVASLITASVVEGKPDMRKQVVRAVIVRQKKEYRRMDGTRIKFEDNSAVVLKDDAGNLKGTMIKGPVAKEACDRFPAIAKLASIVI